MSEMEEKLGAILNNPQIMQQIFSMAQAMGSGQEDKPQENAPQEKKEEPAAPPSPGFDPRLLQNLAQTARQSGVDHNQQALLRALSPYLSANRVHKLERAMRAAKMAGAASAFLNSGGLQLLNGR